VQLGLNDRKSRHEPNLVVLLDGIPLASVAAGKRHSVALGQDGRIYTWCVCSSRHAWQGLLRGLV